MQCFFDLVSAHQTVTDQEGLEVTDWEEAHRFAREAAGEMIAGGVGEIAHWRGWRLEVRDGSGTVLFRVGFDALSQADAAVIPTGAGTCAYDKAA